MAIEPGLLLEAREQDGKGVVVNSPATEGWRAWITGAGDDLDPTPPASGRGEGTKLRLSFTGAETKSVSIQFTEPVELHDGQLFYTPVINWTMDDRWDFKIELPATIVTPNGLNAGNCNLIPQTGYNIIIPAAGDGTHDVVLTDAVPIPTDSSNGFWDVVYNTGEITPSATPGSAKWFLFDVPLNSWFLKNMPMGHPLGVFDSDIYKTEYCHQSWLLTLTVTKNSIGVGEVGGWLMCFRRNTT